VSSKTSDAPRPEPDDDPRSDGTDLPGIDAPGLEPLGAALYGAEGREELAAVILEEAAQDREAGERQAAGAPGGDGESDERGVELANRDGSDDEDELPYGKAGSPLNRSHPFFLGFVGAIGVLTAMALVSALAQLSSVFTLIIVAMFLAMALDPVVQWLMRRGLPRGLAVTVVFLLVIGVFVGILSAVVPPLVTQGSSLANQLPDLLNQLLKSPTVRHLDNQYHIVSKASADLKSRVANGNTLMSVFGGVFGAGKAVVSGFFAAFTVLVLTLYFLASLHNITEAAYRMVPASRRDRVRLLSDEIIRRIGGYVAGQIAVASINAVCTYIVVTILGLPYGLVLAICVGLIGLIPLIGATLGATIVVLVGMFQSWQIGVGLIIYYVVYQQVENYLISPKIMARTVSVPGAVAMIAALAGGSLLGMLGALIGIPIAAGVLLIIQEVVVPRQDRS